MRAWAEELKGTFRRCVAAFAACAILFGMGRSTGYASDHLDSPTVIADPAADIGDMYAWTSADGRRLNLVMDVVAHRFSDRLQYVFHVDSGRRFGRTTATIMILCEFAEKSEVACWAGGADYAHGDASKTEGIDGENGMFRVFAGLRDDPFFNNVKGTRAALNVAGDLLKKGTPHDVAGCPRFDPATVQAISEQWRHTLGGPASNFLTGWQSSSLVISIDLDVVSRGGKLLAVWGAVHKAPKTKPPYRSNRPKLGIQIERVGRPLIKNGLLGPLDPDAVSDPRKEAYNRSPRAGWQRFATDIQKTLALYDAFDGRCGNQWLAEGGTSRNRYSRLAKILSDDRLWVNSQYSKCTQFFAVEQTEFAHSDSAGDDCGGRTPNYDASNIFRSLLTSGTSAGGYDGLDHDDKTHSTTEFPFLAMP